MDAVALAATVGGSVVALAGVGVTAWGAKQQRASAKELAEAQQAHERKLASGGRLFERRAAVYERMEGVMHRLAERVEATEPILRMSGDPEPPEPPTPDEQRAMQTPLRTFGSKAVADAYGTFMQSVLAFFVQATTLRAAREARGAVEEPWREVEDARAKVRANVETVERLVREDLAS
jgi:hypothetical protein